MNVLLKNKTVFKMPLPRRFRAAILVVVIISVFNACRSDVPTADNPKYGAVENLWRTVPVYAGFSEVKTETPSTVAEAEIIK